MGSVKTGSDGTFRVSGDQNKIRTIDPKVNIYHKCNYNGVSFLFQKKNSISNSNFSSSARKKCPSTFQKTLSSAEADKMLEIMTLELSTWLTSSLENLLIVFIKNLALICIKNANKFVYFENCFILNG